MFSLTFAKYFELKKYAVIVAGGSGVRMGGDIPKQYMRLHGKPVLSYSLEKFLAAFPDLEIVLVVGSAYEETARNLISDTDYAARVRITTGGHTRFHSVKNGLHYIDQPSIVFIHDAVRCLLSTDLILRCYETALLQGNAVPAIMAVDSIRINTNNGNESVPRRDVRLIQTPQTFQSEIIIAAFKQDYDAAFTDEATLVERLGIKINLVEGESTNIKLTNPIDLYLAERLLAEKK